MADLILWRHAEAEASAVSGRDADRMLTKRGRKDAARMANWLKQYLPADAIVLCSPARRCQETVAALSEISNIDIRTADSLGVNGTVQRIVTELATLDSLKTILLVGHQPNFGLLIAKLLGIQESACVVKKGAVWWLRERRADDERKTALQTYLVTVQHPDFLS